LRSWDSGPGEHGNRPELFQYSQTNGSRPRRVEHRGGATAPDNGGQRDDEIYCVAQIDRDHPAGRERCGLREAQVQSASVKLPEAKPLIINDHSCPLRATAGPADETVHKWHLDLPPGFVELRVPSMTVITQQAHLVYVSITRRWETAMSEVIQTPTQAR
jgi:hypothetical protein